MKRLATKLPVNWFYVTAVAAGGSAAIGFLVWALTSQVYRDYAKGLPMSGGWSWPVVIVLDSGCVTVLVALFWKIYCDANTEMGDEELCRPSIFGQRRIRWSEVTRVDRVYFGYHVFSGKKRIVLSPHAYTDPDSIVALLRTRVEGGKRGAQHGE
jgi:hypothetical protein